MSRNGQLKKYQGRKRGKENPGPQSGKKKKRTE
jgi:hypothetical protein